jgi:GNAT superfamily N-acetyltransferase
MTIEIREMTAADYPAYEEHLLIMSMIDRRARFEGGMSDAAVIGYAIWMKTGKHIFGAFDGDHLCGVGELRPAPDGRGEAALSVDHNYRRQGLASKLFERLTRCAMESGMAAIDIVALPTNAGIRALAKKFGITMAYSDLALRGSLKVN